MIIQKTKMGDNVTLALCGRLDTVTSSQLQEALIPAFDESETVELDIENLTYISSAGLRVLLMGQKTATVKNRKMKVINVSADVMDVFKMTGFNDILTIA